MKRIALCLLVAAMTAVTMAGIVSKETSTVYRILLADGTLEKGTAWPKTPEECVARAKAILPKGHCVTDQTFENAGSCDDVPKPKVAREVDADGFVVKPPFRSHVNPADDTDYIFEVQDYVAAPYPECWVIGWRVATLEETNGVEESVVAENVMEPVIQSAEFQADWHSAEAEAARHEKYQCYDDDKTPCPARPVVNTACGEEFCGPWEKGG